MEENRIFTPTRLNKKPHTQSGTVLPKITSDSKNYLPSRYIPQKITTKNFPQEILHNVQQLTKTIDNNKQSGNKIKSSIQPKMIIDMYNKKSIQSNQFKSKPMKRYESDYLSFKQIFVQPRQQVLKKIRNQKLNQSQNKNDRSTNIKEDDKNQSPDKKDTDIKHHFDVAIQFLDTKQTNELPTLQASSNFYEQQIKVQPPDLPNSSIASTLTPGNGYAPSIPLTYMMKQNKTNLRDLLVRAKAGIYAQDVQKQAHLSFFLGMVYENRKQYSLAVKFYRRFLGFAKTMEDKIGMALGSNRVAVNQYYNNNITKSITYHQQNLKLSDNQNSFAGFYNIGICYRKLQKYNQSVQYFENALQWALQRDQVQEYSITYGQLGLTYMKMQLYQQSLQSFEKSLQLCKRLKKTEIVLDNLLFITKISQKFNLKSENNINLLLQDTLKSADILNKKKIYNLTVCNLGISRGKVSIQKYKQQCSKNNDIEQIQ